MASDEVKRKKSCDPCRRFFEERRYVCSARSHGECDCPKCQGYCKCRREGTEARREKL